MTATSELDDQFHVFDTTLRDGARRILFQSSDPTLIPAGDTNDGTDAFVRHLR